MGPSGDGPVDSLARRAWLVPAAAVLALLLGYVLAGELRFDVDPSGIVQPSASVANGLDAENVIVLFGTPWAALAATAVAYAGLGRRRAWPFALAGVASGAVILAGVGAACVGLGMWWIGQLPTDTNATAVYLTLLLAPAGILSLLFATGTAPIAQSATGAARWLRYLWLGVLFGFLVGALIGGDAAVLTWSYSCPQDGYTNCFSVSSVLESGAPLGALAGAAVGVPMALVAWMVRHRGPVPEGAVTGGGPADVPP